MKHLNITKTTLGNIDLLRKEYLQSLPEFQELFIEMMIPESEYFLLENKSNAIGYAIRNNEGVLIEFYVRNRFIPESSKILLAVIKKLSIADIYCKSFDSLLLSNCLLNSFSYSLLGVLYRDFIENSILKDESIIMKKADLSSRDFLLSQDNSLEELYESDQLLTNFLLNEHVFTFHKEEKFIGCGMVIKTKDGWNHCDLGVWVKPENRGCGTGSQIINLLREFALKNNLKPSCGCAIENIASQKAIEKSGFVSKYKLINFKTDQG